MKRTTVSALLLALLTAPAYAQTLLEEHFDDAALASRGWYDNTKVEISTAEKYKGAGSAQYTFNAGATTPTSGGAIRHKIPETESVYIRYYIKYSSNWVGSGKSYHPHQFYFMTNKDSEWSGLAETYLTAYLEDNGGQLQFVIQDTKNIDNSRINVDLTTVTEARAVAGCNGGDDDYSTVTCYRSGSTYRNGRTWKTGVKSFSDAQGPNYKGDWHLVEAYFKLNSIAGGKGQPDGVIRIWVDGQKILDRSNIMMRTAKNADMRINQVAIGPYIGDGSPVRQSFWVDELLVATERPQSDVAPPSAPHNLRVAMP